MGVGVGGREFGPGSGSSSSAACAVSGLWERGGTSLSKPLEALAAGGDDDVVQVLCERERFHAAVHGWVARLHGHLGYSQSLLSLMLGDLRGSGGVGWLAAVALPVPKGLVLKAVVRLKLWLELGRCLRLSSLSEKELFLSRTRSRNDRRAFKSGRSPRCIQNDLVVRSI